MRTKTITLYTFDELSDEAKEKVIGNYADFNVDHEWWDSTYEDANNIGLVIEKFALGGGKWIEGALTETSSEVCRRIFKDHGKQCDTYKTAQAFWQRRHDGDSMDEDEFRGLLLEDYFSILDSEYDYLQSEEAIADTIRANDYEFTEDGEIA